MYGKSNENNLNVVKMLCNKKKVNIILFYRIHETHIKMEKKLFATVLKAFIISLEYKLI